MADLNLTHNSHLTLYKPLTLLICLLLLSACDLTDKPEKTTSLAQNGVFSANLSEHYALTGTLTGHAELWELKPKSLIHKWQHTDDNNGVIALDISSREEYAVTAEKNSIAWWRINDGTLLSVWSLPDIFSVSISPDGQFALVGLADKAIYLALQYGKTQYAFKHEDIVLATDLSDSGRYAVTGSEDNTAKLWDLSTGELAHSWQHDNKLATVAISHDDKYVLTNAALSLTRLWKVSTGKLYKQIGPKRVTLSSVSFSGNDKYLLAGHVSQRIELWSLRTGKLVKFWRPKKTEKWRPTAATILALGFVSKDKKFYSIATNGYLQRWRRK
jgi:WD40 repeat protein